MPRRRSMSSTGYLPVELTSFVGRRRELNEVKRLLEGSRLVTVTGVGGSGKTRLALRAAEQLRRAFPDGAWFVDLAALRAPGLPALETQEPDVVAYLMMAALGLREQADGPPMEQLVRFLAGRQAMLVLDNCEHLLTACAVLADMLLRSCGELRILVTSRERLRVSGEVLFTVPPLLTPEPGAPVNVAAVEPHEAVALFTARARAAAPGFVLTSDNVDAVAELCRRLDGLPLAVELAAARVRMLEPAQILARLSERFVLLSRGSRAGPERQQTLRMCVDWSFELCSKPERLLWARLSVFVGGCDLEAIEGVCPDPTLPGEELIDVVTGLVEKSIVASEHVGDVVRYRMLETLRDYGQEELADAGEEGELRRRHCDWYTALVRRAEADWLSSRQAHWFTRLDRELPNIRVALQHSLADPNGAEAALTVAAGLLLYWLARGLHREARSWLDQALARPADASMTRLKALYANITLAGVLDDLPAASSNVRMGRLVAAQLGDARALAIMSSADGVLGILRGDLAGAVSGYQGGADGLAAEPAEDYLFWRLGALTGLARAKGLADDVAGAAAIHELVLEISQARRESWYFGLSLYNLGLGLWKRGDVEAAAARLREGLQRLRRVGDTFLTARCLDALAWIRGDQDRPERVATMLGITSRLADTIGARLSQFPDAAAGRERAIQRARAVLGAHAYQATFARGEGLSLDEAVAYALDEPGSPTAPSRANVVAPLTRREQQVAHLIAQGLSNGQVAATLVISQRTAESHVEHILAKLGFTSRTQVASWMAAQQEGDQDGRPQPAG